MMSGNTEDAKFCSPALVNAICSVVAVSILVLLTEDWCTNASQFTSPYAHAVDAAVGGNIRKKFYNEARKLLDNEAGRPSLSSAQALLTLYMYSTVNVMDRAGYMYRMLASEMYRRLQLGTESALSRKPYWSTTGRALSRNAWGFFCLERQVIWHLISLFSQREMLTVQQLSRLCLCSAFSGASARCPASFR